MSEASKGARLDPGAYTIRPFEPGDRDAFLDLYEAVWGTPKTTEWFHWRFEENPYHDAVEMVVAEHDGALVGAEPLLAFPVRSGDETAFAYQPADWMVHPDHRRRGLSTRMTAALLETAVGEASLLFNFPTEALLSSLVRFDWHPVGTVGYYHRIQRPAALVAASVRRGSVPRVAATPSRLVDPLVRGYRSVRDRLGQDWGEVEVARHETVPAAAFVDCYAAGPPRRVHVVRDEAFYRWRYANPTWAPTTYLARRRGQPVAGAIVVTERVNGIDRACVLEVQPVDPTENGALEAVLKAVVDDHRDADMVKLAGAGLPTDVLHRLGFHRADVFPLSLLATKRHFAVRPLAGGSSPSLGGRDPTARDAWSIQLADQHLD